MFDFCKKQMEKNKSFGKLVVMINDFALDLDKSLHSPADISTTQKNRILPITYEHLIVCI